MDLVEQIVAESTKKNGNGRFMIELKRDDDDYTAYEVFHFVEQTFFFNARVELDQIYF